MAMATTWEALLQWASGVGVFLLSRPSSEIHTLFTQLPSPGPGRPPRLAGRAAAALGLDWELPAPFPLAAVETVKSAVREEEDGHWPVWLSPRRVGSRV